MICPNQFGEKELDFLKGADNVYRTDDYIVRQEISVTTDDVMIGMILSTDTYFERTPERDAAYEMIFAFRGEQMDGKRMKAKLSVRKYVV